VVEDGFLYITDVWSVVYKIDVRSGTAGRVVWKMDPGTQKPDRNRGVALWGNYVISVTGLDGRVIAHRQGDRQDRVGKELLDQPDLEITAAAARAERRIIVGASGGDQRRARLDRLARSQDRRHPMEDLCDPGAGVSPARRLGRTRPTPWKTGGGAMYVTGSYDPATNLTYWGTGNPVPRYDSGSRPGDNLYTDSTVAFGVKDGKIQWHFQHTAKRHPRLRHLGLADHHRRQGPMAMIASWWCTPTANGFNYTFDRLNGQFPQGRAICPQGELDQGASTPRPASRSTTTPARTCRPITTIGNPSPTPSGTHVPTCMAAPTSGRRPTPTRPSFSISEPSEGCADIHARPQLPGCAAASAAAGTPTRKRIVGSLTVVDPLTAEVKLRKDLPYPDLSGVLTHPRAVIVVTAMLDGTILAYDDQDARQVVGGEPSATGFVAPPMTYAVNGRQYIAVASGIGPVGKAKIARSPELKSQGNATLLCRVRAVTPRSPDGGDRTRLRVRSRNRRRRCKRRGAAPHYAPQGRRSIRATGRRKTKIAGRIVMRALKRGTRAFRLLRLIALAIPLCVVLALTV